MTLSALKTLLVAHKQGAAANADLAITAAAMLTDYAIANEAFDAAQAEAHGIVFTPDVSGDWPAQLADVGSALDDAGANITALETKVVKTYIDSPSAAWNADVPVASITNNPVVEFAPTATRKIDPRAALTSMLFTVVKTNSAAFGIVIDVTTGGNQEWTTPAGLNTNYTLLNSALAFPGAWVIRVDLPNKTVIVSPTADILTAATPEVVGLVSAVGNDDLPARADHVHGQRVFDSAATNEGSNTYSISAATDQIIRVESGAVLTLQLPNPTCLQSFLILKAHTGVDTITLAQFDGGDYIQGVDANYILPGSANTDYPAWTVWSTGTAWWVA